MKSSNLEQSLSALMDGQADDLELQRVLQQSQNPQLRTIWQRMHMVRCVMRKEQHMPVDLSARISQALADEQLAPAPAEPRRTMGWSKLAVAASVALAVLVGTKLFLGEPLTAEDTPVMAASEQSSDMVVQGGPLMLASYGNNGAAQSMIDADSQNWYQEQLPKYVLLHNSHAGVGVQVVPYARAASVQEHR